MEDLEQEFKQAAQNVMKLSNAPDNNTLLKLYALYKQGTAGDVQGKRPGMINLKGRAKHDAWDKLKGKSKESAMKDYVALVNGLMT
ncbi:MAG: acyl-CoA-binding protein [Deltaproteobacteria bacterium RIFOXYA12_FULL_58_15]|nr:MAG: acyl-CoA-binding protein [Deltaproteobacteria bacterium RIFOXYA12_FULL_58_15]